MPRRQRTRVMLSSASVFPEPLDAAFEIAAELGYDGIEVMIWGDPTSQDPDAINELIDQAQLPVGSVHAPCLLVTARVWGTDPGPKLARSVTLASRVQASTVVIHPPFRWQPSYARQFRAGVRELERLSSVTIAVENMFPVRVRDREVSAYAPHWDVADYQFGHYTLDTSHAVVSRSDPVAMRARMGGRLAHVHLGDGLGGSTDEHLVPGRGVGRCGEVLAALGPGYRGDVVVEVSTRSAERAERMDDLNEALQFARRHLP
ncbi:MAG: sugar phosphate isomerase/epimerase family protein [Cumulibacter sp.]